MQTSPVCITIYKNEQMFALQGRIHMIIKDCMKIIMKELPNLTDEDIAFIYNLIMEMESQEREA